MMPSHPKLIVLGLLVQVLAVFVAPRRFRGTLAGLATGLDVSWLLWHMSDHRALSVSGFWAITPLTIWIAGHALLTPLTLVEFLARRVDRWRWPVRWAGAFLVILVYGWGLGEAYGPPVVTRRTLAFQDLPPAFDGYRIILVSDLHAGPYIGTRTLERWARTAAEIPCDLMVMAGDCVNRYPAETERPAQAFAIVTPPDGRIAVMGNHDQAPGPLDVPQRMERHGWRVLDDEEFSLTRSGQRLVFLGARYPLDEKEAKAIPWKGRPWPEGFRIGVCHSPVDWPLLLKEGARLTLAGHTHGGQVNLSPLFNAAEEFTPYVFGAYERDSAWLYVTRGLGVTSLPFRFRCRPEIAVLTLHRS